LAARADVQVNLAPGAITQGQPFEIGFEIQGAGGGMPDLSPLMRDFEILRQNNSHSSRNINGQVSQRSMLNLTLVAKRSGDLEIPAVSFGQERSNPQRIKVAAGEPGTNPQSFQPDPGAMAPFPPQQGYSQSFSYSSGASPPLPDRGAPMAGPGWGAGPGTPSAPAWGGGAPPWGGMPGGHNWLPPSFGPGAPGVPAAEPPPHPAPAEGSAAGIWPWIAALTSLGWLLTSLGLWRVLTGRPILPERRLRPAAPAPAPIAPAAAKPQQTPDDLLQQVREAYGRNDPFAAKDALLRWAGGIWPGDPPSNLSRLAVRCPPQVQRHILKLDEALYSPAPVAWNDPSLLEQLVRFAAPLPGAEPGPAPAQA
jgi:hypothetical protein